MTREVEAQRRRVSASAWGCWSCRESFAARSSSPFGRHSVRINLLTTPESGATAGLKCGELRVNTVNVVVGVDS